MLYRIVETWRLRTGVGILVLLLAGCTSTGDVADGIPDGEPCAVVNELIAAHADGFTSLRGSRSENRYADVWAATRRAIGGHCEIWDSGRHQSVYMCTRSAPNAAAAEQYFDSAHATVRSCLGMDWAETSGPREDGRGAYVRFGSTAAATELTIQRVRSEGILRDQWTVYYAIGDPVRLRQ